MEPNCQIHGTATLAVAKKIVIIQNPGWISESVFTFRIGLDYSLSVTVLEPRKFQRIAYTLYQLRYPRRNLDQLNKDRAADSEEWGAS